MMSEKEENEVPEEEDVEKQEQEVMSEKEPGELSEEPLGTSSTEESEDETEEASEEVDEPDEDTIVEGDFLLVEMTGRTVETGEVFDTTDEETARTENIYSEDSVYGPKLVVVGEGWVLKGLDDRLAGLKVEEEAEVEIPPAEAFGERSPANVRMMPFRVLRSKGINPTVGAQVEVDGRSATVRSVGAGRVQLDFNHPRAGRKIVYNIKATKRFRDDEDRIKALIGRRFLGIDVDKFKLKMLKKKIRIQIPDEIFFGENIQVAKRGVALDIQKFFSDFDEIEYTEVIKRST